ncbi:hypothetical protein [Bifidobacterium cuniculi]|uniref:hypothetical protein n=1 Tax=Bifidobacterium cuniculi TaxID=1688 RepID=UPI00052A115B|nr:hypothetical protein [Bifidobacterium cuniculi]
MSIELITWEPQRKRPLADDTDPQALHDELALRARNGETVDVTGVKGERITLNPARLQAWTIETDRK